MKKKLLITMFICCQILAPMNHGLTRYVLIERTVASVGENVILESDLERYTCYIAAKEQKPLHDLDKRKLLTRFIDQIVLVEEAKKTGISEPDREAVIERLEMVKLMFDQNDRWCEFKDGNEKILEEIVYNEILVGNYIKKRVEMFVKITEEDVYKYYLSRRDIFTEEYNEDMARVVAGELKKVLVEKELSDFLRRIKKRIRIVIPED